MSSIFHLFGGWTATPAEGSPSADPDIPATFDEKITLSKKHYDEVLLSGDSPVSIAFGGLTSAHAVVLKVPSAKVIARFTSADGSTQSIPVEEILILTSLSTPFTAIDLTRVAGVSTSVNVFLGQR